MTTTFSEDARAFVDEYMVWSGRSDNTRVGYRAHLRDFCSYMEHEKNGQLYTDEVTTQDIEGYLLHLKTTRKLTESTISKHLSCFKSFFKYAIRIKIRSDDPASLIPTPSVKRHVVKDYLTADEVEKATSAIEQPVIRFAARLMFRTGLRIGEATNLKLADVNVERGTLLVRNGKGNKDRRIPLSAKAKELVITYLDTYRPDLGNDFFFPAPKGALCGTYVSRVIREAAVKAGLTKRVTCHTLRHSFATTLYKSRVGLREIQELLGHASLASTQIYTHVDEDDLRKAVNQL